MAATFQNSATVLSIGIFFTMMILGLAASLPAHMFAGLTAQGVPAARAHSIAALPPVGTLFASLLGYNPIQQLLGPTAHTLPAAKLHLLTGRSFFPQLISSPFHSGLQVAFTFAIVACLIAALASWLRGGKYHYIEGAELRTQPTAIDSTRTIGTHTGLVPADVTLGEPAELDPPAADANE
jgi:hypothetical protein